MGRKPDNYPKLYRHTKHSYQWLIPKKFEYAIYCYPGSALDNMVLPIRESSLVGLGWTVSAEESKDG